MEARLDHLHWELDASPRDTLEITVDQPANVLLMDTDNYYRYLRGEPHSCYGGAAEKGTVTLKPFRAGKWHIAVDMGRSGGVVSAVVKNRATGQPIGKLQARYLKGAASKTEPT